MSRIFASLSVVASTLLIIVMVLGLQIGEYNETYRTYIDHQKELASIRSQVSNEQKKHRIQELESQSAALKSELIPMKSRSRFHILFAVFVALIAILVNCISVTYFIGTSRWCKEVVQTYALNTSFVDESNTIKRKCFPWSFLGMITVLGIAVLGAASDPATLRETTPEWVSWHLWVAVSGICLVAFAFVNQYKYLFSHTELVARILDQVRQIRIERGLDVEEHQVT